MCKIFHETINKWKLVGTVGTVGTYLLRAARLLGFSRSHSRSHFFEWEHFSGDFCTCYLNGSSSSMPSGTLMNPSESVNDSCSYLSASDSMSSSFSLNCPILNSTNLQLLPSNRRFTEYRCFESDPSLAVAISPLSAMYLSVFLGLYPALVSCLVQC